MTIVRLSSSGALPGCLRKQVLHDCCALKLPGLAVGRGESMLAETDKGALLVADAGARRYRAAALPDELAAEEVLRDRLRAGRFIALLGLALLLRRVTDAHTWAHAPLRAAFILDDPNLHWSSSPTLLNASRRPTTRSRWLRRARR